MRSRALLLILLTSVLAVSFPQVTAAQGQNTCLPIVVQSLSQFGTNCADTESNGVCAGSESVTFILDDEQMSELLAEPGDSAVLTTVQTVQTSALDRTDRTWGLSLLNVQANLPQFLDDPYVKYIMLGGIEVENAVEPEDAVTLLEEGVSVLTTAETEFRSPAVLSTPEVVLGAGVTLLADAISPDGEWVRAVYASAPGWVMAEALQSDVNLTTLPVIGPEDFTPMQSFYFRTGLPGDACADAQSLLIIQGPTNVPVDIRVNEIDIRLESTMVLRTMPPGPQVGNRIEIFSLFGLVTINPDTPDAIYVPAGYTTNIGLCEPLSSLGIEGDVDEKPFCGSWATPRVVNQGELDLFGVLNRLPRNVLHYIIDIPRIIRASGIGGVIPRLLFANPAALNAVRRNCEAGRIPEAVCEFLIGS